MKSEDKRRDGERVPPSAVEKAFVIIVLLASTGAFLNLAVKPDADLASGLPAMQWVWSMVYIVTIWLAFRYCRGEGTTIRREWSLILLLTVVFLSTFWSDDRGLTIRHALALAFSTLFAFYVACRYSIRQQLRYLAVMFAVVATASVIFQLLGFGTAVDAAEGVPGWIGVFVQKNQLGLMMAIAAAVFVMIRQSDREYRSWATLGFAFACVLLLLSRSMTAVVVLVVFFISLPVLGWFCRHRRRVILSFTILIGLLGYFAVWTIQNLPTVTEFIGKDVSLTGRIPLWILSGVMALQRPWLGYGYDAFWRGKEGSSAVIWRVLTWGPPHSHNGFLEIWLGLGLLGLVVFTIGSFTYISRAIGLLGLDSVGESRWPAVFLLLLFLSNLVGANLVSRNSLYWILYVTVGISSARSSRPKGVLVSHGENGI